MFDGAGALSPAELKSRQQAAGSLRRVRRVPQGSCLLMPHRVAQAAATTCLSRPALSCSWWTSPRSCAPLCKRSTLPGGHAGPSARAVGSCCRAVQHAPRSELCLVLPARHAHAHAHMQFFFPTPAVLAFHCCQGICVMPSRFPGRTYPHPHPHSCIPPHPTPHLPPTPTPQHGIPGRPGPGHHLAPKGAAQQRRCTLHARRLEAPAGSWAALPAEHRVAGVAVLLAGARGVVQATKVHAAGPSRRATGSCCTLRCSGRHRVECAVPGHGRAPGARAGRAGNRRAGRARWRHCCRDAGRAAGSPSHP